MKQHINVCLVELYGAGLVGAVVVHLGMQLRAMLAQLARIIVRTGATARLAAADPA